MYRRLGGTRGRSGRVRKISHSLVFDPGTSSPQRVAISTELSRPPSLHIFPNLSLTINAIPTMKIKECGLVLVSLFSPVLMCTYPERFLLPRLHVSHVAEQSVFLTRLQTMLIACYLLLNKTKYYVYLACCNKLTTYFKTLFFHNYIHKRSEYESKEFSRSCCNLH